MTNIPDDVMKVAWDVEHKIAASIVEDRYSMTDTAEMIAIALMDEHTRALASLISDELVKRTVKAMFDSPKMKAMFDDLRDSLR